MPTILVVDDNEVLRGIVKRRLMRRGYHVLLATDGKECLDIARAEHPDVILLDMSMPVMDGWSAARKLRADPATHDIAIVACTGHAQPADRESALAAGCDNHIAKPFDFDHLLRVIDTLCARRRR